MAKVKTTKDKATATCGLIMPISEIDGCPPKHWTDVRDILTKAVQGIPEVSFSVNLVSEGDTVDVIHSRIVQNTFDADIVVCDVSGRNPNVMFELGLRVAFDKPAVIVKDDKTDFSFDTGVVEHIPYPRDLRYQEIETFMVRLARKVYKTYEAKQAAGGYSPFLKSFGKFHAPKTISDTEINSSELILKKLDDIQRENTELRSSIASINRRFPQSMSLNAPLPATTYSEWTQGKGSFPLPSGVSIINSSPSSMLPATNESYGQFIERMRAQVTK